jgi:hypothetical protein
VPGERGAPARGNEQAPADRNRVGAPTGSGGQNGTRGSTPPRAVGTAPEGDVANLEYARKQTDLVLEKLSEQLNRTGADDDLLKKLGWTKEDLQRFVDRWRQRKEAAQRSEPAADAARRDLDDALRSLGLRAGQLRQSQVRDDELRDLSQGYRGPVPLELQERLRAYNQGVSQAREK